MQTPSEKVARSISIALWLITFVAVSGILVANGLARSVTPIYHAAVEHWLAGQPLYYGPKEFNYLPSFVQFFRPFQALPKPVGDILWRLLAFAGLFIGLRNFVALLAKERPERDFLLVTLLALPMCVSALRNGQSSAQLAACLVLAAWYLYRGQWTPASFWICLSLVCKPLGLPGLGLALMMFPHLWWRLGLGLALVLGLPYGFASFDYVSQMYADFAANIAACQVPTTGRTFADLNGVLRLFGMELSGRPLLLSQVIAGGILAMLAFFIGQRGNSLEGALAWLGLTGSYIMLFTPMNEGNSYVMLAPALGLWALWALRQGHLRWAAAVIGISAAMNLLPEFVSLSSGANVAGLFVQFWYPLMTLFFLAILIHWILQDVLARRHG